MQKSFTRVNKISLIGLGYVGLPIAVAFAQKEVQTIAFDINREKVSLYKRGMDPTKEVGNEQIRNTQNIIFTSDPVALETSRFHIVAVPTPVNDDHTPNLQPVEDASKILGQHLKSGSIVVYESTVYPGVTEEICVPILEKESGLICGKDFKVGYSPERINPGDKKHRLKNIIKIVSGMDEETLEIIADTYSIVVEAGVYKASSIKVAESAKVIENSQRDINIAFMNELALIFDKMGIDTKEVLEAAGTKWNFLNFTPGLVGGHCIGVDPYYLTYKAQRLGYFPEVILSGRKINDNMGKLIAEKTVKKLIEADIPIKHAKVAILGLTFKENCPDVRNSKVFDIIKELEEFGIEVIPTDDWADPKDVYKEYKVKMVMEKDLANIKANAVIIAVAHTKYLQMSLDELQSLYIKGQGKNVLIDVKGVLNKKQIEKDFIYWRL
ncbi:nucleotide sugar dehydrogenase [Aminipila luticellarii]|uniref:Nucleotide sugar dehydrogenase n=1 Tax=Aminipila luticellarii TaxID=2507160 RepID=A0A410PSQ4_9FIRM|nr:nucleotide sugar dehydrogenase [Aminipila luticellarii]QAT41898.1 nucleotide sugar dehydrogenase [Aminipila luticellarii]